MLIIFRLFNKILKNVWLEFWNEFDGAWTGKNMVPFWGKGFTKLPWLIQQIIEKGTAILYIIMWWGAFGIVFFGASVCVPILLFKYEPITYGIIWLIIISIPVLGGFIGGWIYDKATKNVSN